MGAKIDLRAWLDLVAIGTIADLAPLTGDNRRLVRAGLKRLASASARPALKVMREAAKIRESAELTARDVAFRFSPRLNAPGRLGEADLTLRFLSTQKPAEARRLLVEIESRNEQRKTLGERATQEALAQARELYGDTPKHGVVLASQDWHRGVVGIVAARVVDALGVPAVVVAFDGDRGHGSVRTVGGFDVYQALSQCASDLSAWGGHRAAAGLSLEVSALDRFRAAFADAAPEGAFDDSDVTEVDIGLGGAYRVPSLDDLQRVGPFGQGYPTPLFRADAYVVSAKGVGEGGVHGKLELRIGQDRVRAFAPQMFSRVDGRESLSVVGEFQPDHWLGGGAVELLVKDVLD